MPEIARPDASDEDPLAALRALDLARRDPVRLRLAEALARRAAAQTGGARRVLDDRLAALVARLAAAADAPPPPDAGPPAPATPGPLARLAAHAAREKGAPVFDAVARPAADDRAAPPAGAAADARTLAFFKRTWSRLSAEQRLAQSRAALPENAGPLNSQHLVHRALTRMQALSPEYLARFVGYIDALQWLERANESTPAAPARRSMPARR